MPRDTQSPSPVDKVAGLHRKDRGKQCAEKLNKRKRLSDDEDVFEVIKRGHPKGAGNYTAVDLGILLDAVEDEKPLSQCGWANVGSVFNRKARKKGRFERDVKSLETKYKQVSTLVIRTKYKH